MHDPSQLKYRPTKPILPFLYIHDIPPLYTHSCYIIIEDVGSGAMCFSLENERKQFITPPLPISIVFMALTYWYLLYKKCKYKFIIYFTGHWNADTLPPYIHNEPRMTCLFPLCMLYM